jgi:acetyl esterase/lipase
MIDIYPQEKPYSSRKKSLKNTSVKILSQVLDLFRDSPNIKAPSLEHFPSKNNSIKLKPVIIVIPGGGYFGRDIKKEGIPTSKLFQNLGFEVFILNYRVAPFFYPTAIEDGKRAIQFIRYHAKQWELDPQKIGLIGYSAGGHLVSMIAENKEENKAVPFDKIDKISSFVNFQILCYPLIDLKRKSLSMKFVRTMILEKSLQSYSDKELNSALNVTKHTPKTFIWHSLKDKTVSVKHSKLYVNALIKYKTPYQAHFYKNGGHGIGLAKEAKFKHLEVYSWVDSCKKWLIENVI